MCQVKSFKRRLFHPIHWPIPMAAHRCSDGYTDSTETWNIVLKFNQTHKINVTDYKFINQPTKFRCVFFSLCRTNLSKNWLIEARPRYSFFSVTRYGQMRLLLRPTRFSSIFPSFFANRIFWLSNSYTLIRFFSLRCKCHIKRFYSKEKDFDRKCFDMKKKAEYFSVDFMRTITKSTKTSKKKRGECAIFGGTMTFIHIQYCSVHSSTFAWTHESRNICVEVRVWSQYPNASQNFHVDSMCWHVPVHC